MKRKPINRFKHDCKLSGEAKYDYYLYSPYDRWYDRAVIWIRNWLTISRNEKSYQYFKSHASLKAEKLRHLTNPRYRWIIHPFSTVLFWKEIAISILWLMLYVHESFAFFVLTSQKMKIQGNLVHSRYVILIGNVICVADIFTRFFIGYTVEKTREVILEPRLIVRRYLKSYFVFDCMVIFPYLSVLYLEKMPRRMILFIFQFHRLRLIRITMILNSIDRLWKRFKISKAIRSLLRFSLTGVILLHSCTSISGEILYHQNFFKIGNDTWLMRYHKHHGFNKTAADLYFLHLSLAVCHFFGTGKFRYKLTSTANHFFFSCVMMAGMGFYIYGFSRILQFFGVANYAEIKFNEFTKYVDAYMFHKALPTEMKNRIAEYYDYTFNKRFFNEAQIMDNLTDHLRMEVLLYSCQNLIQQVQIFRGLSKDAVGTMLALLKQEIYMKGDQIIDCDEPTGCIYFILYGTCKIKTENWIEIAHVEDGDHFGKIARIDKPNQRVGYSVTALEITEVYKWEKNDIEYCVANFPEIEQKLEKTMKHKSDQYRALLALSLRHDLNTDDIVRQLRKGRILSRGLKRAYFM